MNDGTSYIYEKNEGLKEGRYVASEGDLVYKQTKEKKVKNKQAINPR